MATMRRVFFENVRDIVARPGQMRERERVLNAPEQLGEALAVVPEGERIVLQIRLESVHEGILVSVSVRSTMHAECGRCLTRFCSPIEVEFQELFAYTCAETDEYEVQGDHVDLEPPLRDAVVLALPFQPVCHPRCPGLHPETGQLQVNGYVAPREHNDPRWAALAEFASEENHGEGYSPDPDNK